MKPFGQNILTYKRRKTVEVKIGNIPLGGNNPIRVQSMTTVDTMDTSAVVKQSIRLIKVGCEYIRLTVPSLKDAKQLKKIKDELKEKGYDTPIIADIHYTPNAAIEAALHIEKIRINPGNYVKAKEKNKITYTDEDIQAENTKIYQQLLPLIKLCKQKKVALRIGTNHGSLSNRIMSMYGDTPIGMVESALEYIRICHYEGFDNIVISMKSSNPQIMIFAYRLLVKKLLEEKLPPYPLHLGVTEAGEGEDGRVRSAIGIGTLLADGIGDTVRVSLTEEPEYEIPVAKLLINRFGNIKPEKLQGLAKLQYNPYEYNKHITNVVGYIGGKNAPIVISTISNIYDGINFDNNSKANNKSDSTIEPPDFIYTNYITPKLYGKYKGLITDCSNWKSQYVQDNTYPLYPLYSIHEFLNPINSNDEHSKLKYCFVELYTSDIELVINNKDKFIASKNIIFVLNADGYNRFQAYRHFFMVVKSVSILFPVVLKHTFAPTYDTDDIVLESSTDIGGMFIDGFGNGIWLEHNRKTVDRLDSVNTERQLRHLSFNILQAARQRITKTEYISCPSCGRTLFDLQETTAKIRRQTEHLKGLKIGIMGCIVNGPGEMADADYGYVGSGKGQITLYRGKTVVKKSVPANDAVGELISLIKEDDNWIEPNT